MKKLLFVTNHIAHSNGVAKALLEFVNNLDKTKYDITIMPIFDYDKEFAKLYDSQIKFKPVFKGYFKGLSTLVELIPYKVWYKLLVKEKFDVEIAFQYGFPTKLIAASCNKNAKHVGWMHGYGERHINIHENFDKIVCCSKENEANYKKSFKYPERVCHLYNLIDDDSIIKKSLENVKFEKKYNFTFCAVGRLSPEKGYDKLIRCHKRLLEDGLNNNLWIVGGGDEYKKLKQLVDDNGLNDSVKLFGKQDNPYVYMKNSDMFVCSSEYEGFSTVMVEAAILGKSTLSTLVPGATEFIKNNNVGVVVDNNEEALYYGMKDILMNPQQLKEYEQNIKNIGDMHFKDRLKEFNDFFNNL